MCWVNISSTAQALHHQIVLNTTFQMVSSDLVSCMQCATCKGCLWEGNRESCFCVSSDPKHFRSVEKIVNLRKTVCLVVMHGCSFCLANSWKADSLDYYWENMPVAWMLLVCAHTRCDGNTAGWDGGGKHCFATCSRSVLGGVKMWGGLK